MDKCCFCGKEINGCGNNPYPADKNPDAVCCDHCNMTIVIPTRLDILQKNSQII